MPPAITRAHTHTHTELVFIYPFVAREHGTKMAIQKCSSTSRFIIICFGMCQAKHSLVRHTKNQTALLRTHSTNLNRTQQCVPRTTERTHTLGPGICVRKRRAISDCAHTEIIFGAKSDSSICLTAQLHAASYMRAECRSLRFGGDC